MGDTANDFTEMEADASPEKQTPVRDAKGKFQPAKPAEKPVEKAVEKTPEKPVEKPTEPAKEADAATDKGVEQPKPAKAAELRTAYEGLKKKVKEELEPEVQRLRSKIQEYETKGPESIKPVLEKVKAIEERNAQLERHIALVDYEQSSEYQQKYSEPFRRAWDEATATFGQLEVSEKVPDGLNELDEPQFKIARRPATSEDLLMLANLPLQKMYDRVQEMFGAAAPDVIGHLRDVRKLSAAQYQAKENAKTQATQWKYEREMAYQNRTKSLGSMWGEVNKTLEERFPKAFHVEQSDPDDVASHTKGFALADLLFLGNEALTPEQADVLPEGFRESVKARKPLSEEQKVQLHALARLKMANHDRKVVALNKANARIAELEKSLAEYEKSEPAANKASDGAGAASDKPWDEQVADEIKALDK